MEATASGRPPAGWGTSMGLLQLFAAPAAEQQEEPLRLAVTERLHAYAWAFDERRADLLRSCFTDDAVWHGSLAGQQTVGPMRGVDEIVTFMTDYWPRQHDQRRHFFTSIEVDRVSDREAFATTSLLLTSVTDRLEIVPTSFYRIRLVEEAGRWLIADLFEGGDTEY